MPSANPAVMEFMLKRRSRPAKTLTTPVPNSDELLTLLTAAARVPDHGKLEPWRFIVLERNALQRLAKEVDKIGLNLGLPPEKIAKGVDQYARSHLAVAVIASPKPSEKVPEFEQTLSVGAVCLGLVNAALASGWGACWLTGWASENKTFQSDVLNLEPHEWVAGIIHIGTETTTPPERPRPDINAITQWLFE